MQSCSTIFVYFLLRQSVHAQKTPHSEHCMTTVVAANWGKSVAKRRKNLLSDALYSVIMLRPFQFGLWFSRSYTDTKHLGWDTENSIYSMSWHTNSNCHRYETMLYLRRLHFWSSNSAKLFFHLDIIHLELWIPWAGKVPQGSWSSTPDFKWFEVSNSTKIFVWYLIHSFSQRSSMPCIPLYLLRTTGPEESPTTALPCSQAPGLSLHN